MFMYLLNLIFYFYIFLMFNKRIDFHHFQQIFISFKPKLCFMMISLYPFLNIVFILCLHCCRNDLIIFTMPLKQFTNLNHFFDFPHYGVILERLHCLFFKPFLIKELQLFVLIDSLATKIKLICFYFFCFANQFLRLVLICYNLIFILLFRLLFLITHLHILSL